MVLGLADQLKRALATYTESGGQGNPTYDTKQAIAVMHEKHGIACDMMHGFNWGKWTTGTPTERLQLIPAGQEHILEQEDGKKRWVQVVMELSQAFALCSATDEATAIRDDVSFFQALQAALNKKSGESRKSPEQIDAAIRQLVSKAITTEGEIIDVFTAAGSSAPKARDMPAQGNALGLRRHFIKPCKGGTTVVPPLQGLFYFWPSNPGRCPGLACFAPLGLSQPRHQHDGGHRGTHQTGEGNGRRHQARRRPRPHG